MTPLEALAQAVEAGRAGLPPSPEALDVLAAVLDARQNRRRPGRPRGTGARQIEAVAAMVDLMHRTGKTPEQAARKLAKQFHVSPYTLYENWWLGKGETRKVQRGGKAVSVWRAKGSTLAHDRAEDAAFDAAPPMPDRPDASEEFGWIGSSMRKV